MDIPFGKVNIVIGYSEPLKNYFKDPILKEVSFSKGIFSLYSYEDDVTVTTMPYPRGRFPDYKFKNNVLSSADVIVLSVSTTDTSYYDIKYCLKNNPETPIICLIDPTLEKFSFSKWRKNQVHDFYSHAEYYDHLEELKENEPEQIKEYMYYPYQSSLEITPIPVIREQILSYDPKIKIYEIESDGSFNSTNFLLLGKSDIESLKNLINKEGFNFTSNIKQIFDEIVGFAKKHVEQRGKNEFIDCVKKNNLKSLKNKTQRDSSKSSWNWFLNSVGL